MSLSDYMKYRGKCQEFVERAIKEDVSLTPIRGWYFCPIENKEYQHWWCLKEDGSIYDPTSKQFSSKGNGIYREYVGILECSHCGKEMEESEAQFEGNYFFCSTRCHLRFVGL